MRLNNSMIPVASVMLLCAAYVSGRAQEKATEPAAPDTTGATEAREASSANAREKSRAEKLDQRIEKRKQMVAKRPAKRNGEETSSTVTPAREAAALEFVRNHHPELIDLLEQLKAKSSREYQRVVGELFRTSERLAQLQETDSRRHDVALRIWKMRSRIQVLAARAALSDDPAVYEQLRVALAEQADIRREQLQLEVELAGERLKRAETALANFEQNRAKQLATQQDMLLKQIERARVKNKIKLSGKAGSKKTRRPGDTRPGDERPEKNDER